jgi:glycosyltransferase involved in cell wall biosynthesis
MNKKILIIYQDWASNFQNNYSKIDHWFKNMDQAYSIDNEYLFFSFGTEDKYFKLEKNVSVRLIKSNSKYQILDLFFKFKKELKKEISSFKPDYIYNYFLYLGVSLPFKKLNYKVISFLRDKTAQQIIAKGGIRVFIGYLFYFLDYLAMRKTDILLHNGKSLENYAKKLRYSGKLIYCPRPVSNKEFLNSSSKRSKDIIKKYNLENKIIILTIARLTQEKNIEFGIRTLNLLPSEYIYLIVGEGDLKSNLENLVISENLVGRVHIIDFVEHKYVWDFYNLADVYWQLSKTDFEGTPNVIQESFFAQVPCVVSKISAMKNIVDDKINGLILKTWSSDELSEKTLNLINNKSLYNLIKKNQLLKINYIISKNRRVVDFFK